MSPHQEALFTLADTRGADTIAADPFTAAVPAWLRDRLEDLNPERRSAYAKLVPCRRCEAPVLHAADMGLDLVTESTVDPALLTAGTELEALLAGRYTAELDVLKFGRGIMIYRRDRWLITKAAGERQRYAVPEHRCGAPLGVSLPWSMLYPAAWESATHPADESSEPPF